MNRFDLPIMDLSDFSRDPLHDLKKYTATVFTLSNSYGVAAEKELFDLIINQENKIAKSQRLNMIDQLINNCNSFVELKSKTKKLELTRIISQNIISLFSYMGDIYDINKICMFIENNNKFKDISYILCDIVDSDIFDQELSKK
jgi:hypothetical protein